MGALVIELDCSTSHWLPRSDKYFNHGHCERIVANLYDHLVYRHRERSVAIYYSDFTDYISRVWTATLGFAFLAVT